MHLQREGHAQIFVPALIKDAWQFALFAPEKIVVSFRDAGISPIDWIECNRKGKPFSQFGNNGCSTHSKLISLGCGIFTTRGRLLQYSIRSVLSLQY